MPSPGSRPCRDEQVMMMIYDYLYDDDDDIDDGVEDEYDDEPANIKQTNACLHFSLEEQRGLIGFLNSWNYGVTFEYIKYQFDYITY